MNRILTTNSVSLASVPALQEICRPLERFGITNFIYAKNYRNGQLVHLSNRGDWLEHFYDKGLYKTGTFQQQNGIYDEGFLLWNTLSGQYVVKEAEQFFDMKYGIVLIERNCYDHYEFYAFAGSHKTPNLYNLYVNDLDILRRFILYFRDKGDSILQQADKKRICLPIAELESAQSKPVLSDIEVNNNMIKSIKTMKADFVKETRIQKYHFQAKNLDVYITGRELEIIWCLLNSICLSDISLRLNISKRTVEKHLENLKRKCHCETIQCLKDKFLKNNLKFVKKHLGVLV